MALALRAHFPELRLHIWGRNRASLDQVKHTTGQPIECTQLIPECVEDCDGVILCTPVETMEEQATAIAPHLSPTAWVTDVGSVKGALVHRLESILGSRYIGAHPMAGSEKSGFSYARANLFEQATCLLTPTAQSDAKALSEVETFWLSLGCRVFQLPPEEHDLAIARVSHLPHLIASVLVLAAGNDDLRYVGPGFRDCTRIAQSSPELWANILRVNRNAILNSLSLFGQQLETFRSALEKNNDASLLALLQDAATIRSSLTYR